MSAKSETLRVLERVRRKIRRVMADCRANRQENAHGTIRAAYWDGSVSGLAAAVGKVDAEIRKLKEE